MFGGFKVENPLQDPVAQLVELCTFNAEVIGSSPIRVTIKLTILKIKTMNLKDKTVVIDNKTYHYSKIVMLSSNKGFSCENFNGLKLINNYICSCTYLYDYLTDIKHLYFLSTDKICEGDWCIIDLAENTRVIKVKSLNSGHPIFTVDIEDGYAQLTNLKKIIATTDKSLTFDDCMNSWFLPEPSPEFIQKYIDAYNKGEKIEECLVEYHKVFKYDLKGCDNCLSNKSNRCRNANGTISCKGNSEFKYWQPKNYYDIPYVPKITKGEIKIRKVKDSWSREEVCSLMQQYLDKYVWSGNKYETPMKFLEENL